MEPVITLLALSALAVKVVSTVKYTYSGQAPEALTQVITWLVGVAIIALAAQADLASGLAIPGTERTLGSLDFASQVLVGLSLASAGSVALYDFRKAVDSSDSAREPSLTRGTGGAG